MQRCAVAIWHVKIIHVTWRVSSVRTAETQVSDFVLLLLLCCMISFVAFELVVVVFVFSSTSCYYDASSGLSSVEQSTRSFRSDTVHELTVASQSVHGLPLQFMFLPHRVLSFVCVSQQAHVTESTQSLQSFPPFTVSDFRRVRIMSSAFPP